MTLDRYDRVWTTIATPTTLIVRLPLPQCCWWKNKSKRSVWTSMITLFIVHFFCTSVKFNSKIWMKSIKKKWNQIKNLFFSFGHPLLQITKKFGYGRKKKCSIEKYSTETYYQLPVINQTERRKLLWNFDGHIWTLNDDDDEIGHVHTKNSSIVHGN